ncbi:MAG: hypothetical protein VW405_00800 [Rhodospirillaceae bacterium]
MPRLIHRDELTRLLAAANLTPADADLFELARRVTAHVKGLGGDGFEFTDNAERAALIAAVGEADTDRLTKAIRLAREAGRLVVLP